MPVFKWPEDGNALDYRLLRDGFATRYHDLGVFTGHLAQLTALGYRVHEFDCASWGDDQAMHVDLAKKLRFPSYYGHNWDALNDCMSGLDFDSITGIVLAFRNFDSMSKVKRRRPDSRPMAVVLLDILSRNARNHLIFGHRLIALVQQTSDWRPTRFGTTDVLLNEVEYFVAIQGSSDAGGEDEPEA